MSVHFPKTDKINSPILQLSHNPYLPYSNSKSCSELVTHSYLNSFFADSSVAISTARAALSVYPYISKILYDEKLLIVHLLLISLMVLSQKQFHRLQYNQKSLDSMLLDAGAQVTGYSLDPPTDPNLFSLSQIEEQMDSVIGDIRNRELLWKTIKRVNPEFVIHLAAQPIVRDSYKDPVLTYETNVMGTVNILEAVRNIESVRSFLNVTTDKVYLNREWEWGYREDDPLDGYDPYSVGGSKEYPVTCAPASSNILQSHVPLNPVCPVTNTFFPR